MKLLYLDCGMGAAGDMLTAALLELLPDPAAFVDELNGLGIPGVHFSRSAVSKCGIQGTGITVTVDGMEESEDMYHSHHHSHHHHTGMEEIRHIVGALSVSDQVRKDVLAVYDLIAQAESHAHGCPVTEIHFHEVGTMDAVADITAVCMLMEKLAPDQVLASPVHVGCGQVRCAHGILPVPAPATAYILHGVPIYGGTIRGELCTPTGAALLRHFARSFGEMPVMTLDAVGYGMGHRDFEAANCVRALWGHTEEKYGGDLIAELRCNLDDMTAEAMSFAAEACFRAGALEVYTSPIGMKKSRPGTLLSVLCRPEDKDVIVKTIFQHTTTLGIRETLSRRYLLERSSRTVSTQFGPVSQKISSGYGVIRRKYEYEDLARIAREQDCSMEQVLEKINHHSS